MKPNKIVVHCSDTPNGKITPIEEIRKWHVAKGWSDVGYHEVIQPNGDLEYGRPTNIPGAHVEGANRDSLGICIIGRDKFTKIAFETLRRRLEAHCLVYSIEWYRVYSHAQFPSAIAQGKTCPNIPINELLGWFILKDERVMAPYIYEGLIE